MRTVTEPVVLGCTPETFWRTFLDEAYTQALFIDALEFKSFQLLELGEDSRKTLCLPKVNLPGLDKLVGDSFAYEEHGTLDRDKGQWTWRMVQPGPADPRRRPPMVSTRGTMRIEPVGDARCRRTDEVIVEASLLGLGGMLESTVEREIHAGWHKEHAFLAQWLAHHPA